MTHPYQSPGLKRGSTALSHGRDESSTGAFRADEVRGKVRPYHDNVLVLMDWIRDMRREDVSESGLLVMPGTQKPKPGEGAWATVVEAGAGKWLDEIMSPRPGCNQVIPMSVTKGNRVLVDSADAGDMWLIDGMEHRIIREHNILCVED
jgi:co-chaperonin GroES (HSP10)